MALAVVFKHQTDNRIDHIRQISSCTVQGLYGWVLLNQTQIPHIFHSFDTRTLMNFERESVP